MALTDAKIGVVRLYMNAPPGSQGSVDLGNTLDGVELTIGQNYSDVNVDAYGDTPIDKVLTGTSAMVKTKLAEATFQTLRAAIPAGTQSLDQGTLGKPRLGFGRTAGLSMKSLSFQLILRPLRNVAAGVDTEDVVLYNVISNDDVTIPYKVKDQQVYPVNFIALVNESYEDGRRLGHIGPATIS